MKMQNDFVAVVDADFTHYFSWFSENVLRTSWNELESLLYDMLY